MGEVDAVENHAGTRVFHPLGAALREETAARLRELKAGVPFGALEAFREFEVGKQHLVMVSGVAPAVASR